MTCEVRPYIFSNPPGYEEAEMAIISSALWAVRMSQMRILCSTSRASQLFSPCE